MTCGANNTGPSTSAAIHHGCNVTLLLPLDEHLQPAEPPAQGSGVHGRGHDSDGRRVETDVRKAVLSMRIC